MPPVVSNSPAVITDSAAKSITVNVPKCARVNQLRIEVRADAKAQGAAGALAASKPCDLKPAFDYTDKQHGALKGFVLNLDSRTNARIDGLDGRTTKNEADIAILYATKIDKDQARAIARAAADAAVAPLIVVNNEQDKDIAWLKGRASVQVLQAPQKSGGNKFGEGLAMGLVGGLVLGKLTGGSGAKISNSVSANSVGMGGNSSATTGPVTVTTTSSNSNTNANSLSAAQVQSAELTACPVVTVNANQDATQAAN